MNTHEQAAYNKLRDAVDLGRREFHRIAQADHGCITAAYRETAEINGQRMSIALDASAAILSRAPASTPEISSLGLARMARIATMALNGTVLPEDIHVAKRRLRVITDALEVYADYADVDVPMLIHAAQALLSDVGGNPGAPDWVRRQTSALKAALGRPASLLPAQETAAICALLDSHRSQWYLSAADKVIALVECHNPSEEFAASNGWFIELVALNSVAQTRAILGY